MSTPEQKTIDVSPKKENRFLAFMKNLLVMALLVGVIAGSFWVSYLLGKRLLVPVKNLPERNIEVVMPETSPQVAALQEFQKVEKPAPAKVEIAKTQVKKKVAAKPRKKKYVPPKRQNYYKVQAGLYSDKGTAIDIAKKLNESGFHTYLNQVSAGWRVQAGAFLKKAQALGLQRSLNTKGFSSTVVYE